MHQNGTRKHLLSLSRNAPKPSSGDHSLLHSALFAGLDHSNAFAFVWSVESSAHFVDCTVGVAFIEPPHASFYSNGDPLAEWRPANNSP